MATDERILRLENAMATLAELAAQHDERTASLEKSFQTLTRLTAQHDERVAQHDERIASLEKSFQTLTQLAVSASERGDQQGAWINQLGAAQAEADVKIAALADAQIRTEEALTRLALKVDNLTDLIRGGRDGETGS